MDESPEETEPSQVLTPDTENATYFDPSDVRQTSNEKGTSVNHKRLRLYNRGTWKDRREENKEVTHRQDNLAIFDAISSQLELTSYQKSEGRDFFDRLNLGKLGKPARLIAFGVCAVVANEDVHDGSRYHPQMGEPDDLFVDLADDLDFTTSQLHSVIGVMNDRRM